MSETVVVFRRDRTGWKEPFALFPELPADDMGIHYRIAPKQLVAFSTWPGDGCEEANFGLAVYPGVLDITDPRTGRSRKLRTELKGWCWSSFCKTQYASQHGVDHFI